MSQMLSSSPLMSKSILDSDLCHHSDLNQCRVQYRVARTERIPFDSARLVLLPGYSLRYWCHYGQNRGPKTHHKWNSVRLRVQRTVSSPDGDPGESLGPRGAKPSAQTQDCIQGSLLEPYHATGRASEKNMRSRVTNA